MWCILLLCVAGAHAQYETYLLPRTIRPDHYELRYVFDIDVNSNFSYYGLVDIFFTAKAAENKILLHMQDFTIQEDGMKISNSQQNLRIIKTEENSTFNFLALTLSEKMLENERYTLRIPFFGNLQLGLDGIYISSYKDKDVNSKEKQYLIATQFEAISARKAFPCLDEPIYKATYSIVIGHHKDYTAISNMPLANTSTENALADAWSWKDIKTTFKKDQSDFVWDHFEKSVRMSTYLVAFVVSKFSYVESDPSSSHTKFRIWARKDAINQTTYAANIGPKILSAFEEFFNVSFPLPKQDMIAIPDFAAGAMENWGLITFRETSLLYDKEDTSFVLKERVAEVVAHELAHQWFGNLVTMKWWSDLWLNEGFATYVSTLGVEKIHPDWKSAQITETENIQYVMSSDALESSHPVSVEIDDPKGISEIFDEISYRKGATLIRMMTKFIGEEVFRRALHEYLLHFSYSNAEQDDLWFFLNKVSMQYGGLTQNVSISEIMNSWTKQTGYPLLTLTRNYEDKTLDLTQRRYVHIGALSATRVAWWVPLSVLCQPEAARGQAPPVSWLADTDGVEDKHRFEHGANASQWVLFNYNMIAPIRINYDKRNWELLINTLHSDKYDTIPVMGRVQLISDAFALAWTNHLDYSTALHLLDYLHREKDYLPILIGLRQLVKIENLLKRSADFGAYQKFVRKLITDQYQHAGGLSVKKIINPDDMISVKMQTLTSTWACSAEVPGCEENAVELFNSWMETKDPDNNNPIPLDLRKTVYCTGVARGGVRQWRFLVERLRRGNVAAARQACQRALSCTREVWLIHQYLEMAISPDSEIRSQDVASVITDLASSSIGYYIAKDFIYTRTDDIIKAVQGQQRRIGQIFKVLLNQFTTQKELDEFLAWKKENCKYLDQSKQAISQAIESAKINIDWVKRNRKLVAEKLREFS